MEQLVAFLVSSALECVKEPSPYGALRLMEGAQQLITIAAEHQLIPEDMKEIAMKIEHEKQYALTDPLKFQNLVEELALELVARFS